MPTKTAVTGTVQNVAGNLATSGYVEFQLQPNANSLTYRVSGTTIIAPNSVRATINASGLLKAENGTDPLELWGNDTISPANTFYRAKFFPDGVATQTWNLLLIQGTTYSLNSPQFFEPADFVPNESPPRFQQIESNIIPAYDGQYVLGTDQKKFAAAYIQQLFADTINFNELSISGELDIGGDAQIDGDLDVDGDVHIGDDLTVDGNIYGNNTGRGVVSIFPPTTPGGIGFVFAPDGTPISTIGSTTAGLMEGILYAQVHFHDLHVYGGDETTGGAVVYLCTSTVTIGPAQGKSYQFDACTIAWALSGIGANTGLFVDSIEMVDLDMRGVQLVYGGTGRSVLFKPTNQLPLDVATFIQDCRVFINTPSGDGLSGVEFNMTLGGISGNFFDFVEVGVGSQFGIRVLTPTSPNQFSNNIIRAPHIHGASNTAVQVGDQALAGSARLGPNIWDIGISTEHASARGIDTYATGDVMRVAAIDGPSSGIGVLLEAGASRNQIEIGELVAGASIQDSSTNKTNIIRLRRVKTTTALTVGASPFVYPESANANGYITARCKTVIVTGGTVSVIARSGDNGSTWVTTGMTAGSFDLDAGDLLRVTYTVTPTMTVIY